MKRNIWIIGLIVLCFTLSSCSPPYRVMDDDLSENDIFGIYAFKTVRTIDGACNQIYEKFGELYHNGKISEDNKTKLITLGLKIRTYLVNSKNLLETYMWKNNNGESIDEIKFEIIKELKKAIIGFNIMRDFAENIYSEATLLPLDVNSPFIFNDLKE